jgi:hypothetical protein
MLMAERNQTELGPGLRASDTFGCRAVAPVVDHDDLESVRRKRLRLQAFQQPIQPVGSVVGGNGDCDRELRSASGGHGSSMSGSGARQRSTLALGMAPFIARGSRPSLQSILYASLADEVRGLPTRPDGVDLSGWLATIRDAIHHRAFML